MENPTVVGLLFVAIGVLIMVGAALNWGIVSRSGKLLNRIFGDTVARIIYFVAGTFSVRCRRWTFNRRKLVLSEDI